MDLTGRQFGRWTVLEKSPAPGNARWICRCACGTVRDVLERNLRCGASVSCGCLAKERIRENCALNLKGKRFGKLIVLERGEPGKAEWKCRCDCGRECTVLQRSLQTGRRTSCGCDSRKGKHRALDVRGQRFHDLTALFPTDRRGHNGSVVWHCKCACGNEVDVDLNRLKSGEVISCGCARAKCDQMLPERLTHVAGTSIDAIRSGRLRADNRTGVNGVSMKRGKYLAAITFQKKEYNLGAYETLEAAANARREAERALHASTVRFYERWKRRADANPEWAKENPIKIRVKKDASGAFQVEMQPELDE